MRLSSLILIVVLCGCTRYAVRDARTYAAETAASVARQEEAADALLTAAARARAAGDVVACREYAEPALLIEAAARRQADRALWLAGLPYGDTTGRRVKQPDPGPSPNPRPVAAVCDTTTED